ncbi:MAG: pitrilysin family protein [Microgenomates group bacterium]
MFTHSIDTLKNGLKVLRVEMPGVKSVTAMILANTGSRFERPKEEGIAHFLEHMVFKGTKKYPDPQILASTIDGIGADFNAFTSKEYTGYYVKSASQHIDTALDVLSDMLLQPLLKQEDIDREKGVIIEEINMYQDNPMHLVDNVFEQMFFAGSGLSHDIIGSKMTVSQLEKRHFQQFLQQWYGTANLVLVLAGDKKKISNPKMLETVKEAFSKSTGVRARDKVAMKRLLPDKTPVSSQQVSVTYKKTEQAHLIMGWPSIPRGHKDRYVQAILGVILGGTMSSRLFSEVREKRGLCYYIRATPDYYHDAGVFSVSAGVDPNRAHEALKTIREESLALASGEKPVTDEELTRAIEYATGTLVLGLEDSRSVAEFYGMKETLLGEITDPVETMNQLKKVTKQDVQRLAKKVIVDIHTRLAIVGPFKGGSAFKKYTT